MVDFARHTARIIARLGDPVTIFPTGQPARRVNAVFTRVPADAFGLVAGSAITLRAMASDSSGLLVGDRLSRDGIDYLVAAIESDASDSGDVVLRLETTT